MKDVDLSMLHWSPARCAAVEAGKVVHPKGEAAGDSSSLPTATGEGLLRRKSLRTALSAVPWSSGAAKCAGPSGEAKPVAGEVGEVAIFIILCRREERRAVRGFGLGRDRVDE